MNQEKYTEKKQDIFQKKIEVKQFIGENKWIILIGLLAIFIHLFVLGKVPYGLHLDELGTSYDAWCISNYGVDRYLKSYPLYFINFGGGQNSLYCYLCVFFIKIFGFSTTTIRLPAFLGACILAVSGYYFVWKKWHNKNICLLFMLLYTILPIFTMSSRFGLESYLMLPFSTLFLMCCVSAIEKPTNLRFVFCGITGGLVLYTYALSYIVLPMFLLLLIIYLLYIKNIQLKHATSFVIPMMIFGIPLVLVQVVNRFDLEEFQLGIFTVTKFLSYRSGEIVFTNVLSNLLVLVKNILAYDWLPYNSFKTYGNVYWISIPFILVGLIQAIKETIQSIKGKEFDPTVLILFWALSEFIMGCLLGGNGPNTNKINGIFFCVLYFLIEGLLLIGRLAKKWRKYVVIALAISYTLFSISFWHYYFIEYKDDVYPQHLFAGLFCEELDYLDRLDKTISKRTTYIGNMKQAYIYYLGSTLISPYEYNIEETGTSGYKNYVFSLPDEINLNSNYIVRKSESSFIEEIDALGFEKISFDEYYLYYMKE